MVRAPGSFGLILLASAFASGISAADAVGPGANVPFREREGQRPAMDAPAVDQHGAWHELPPPRRHAPTSVYDPVRRRMLVFGFGAPGTWAISPDDPAGWTPLPTIGAAPGSPRGQPAIYDPIRDRVLVFPGDGSGNAQALTLAGTPAWGELPVGGIPPEPREGHSVVYDSRRDRVILFGGMDYGGGLVFNDAWELPLGGSPEWRPLIPAGGSPGGRHGHEAIYDPTGDRMIVVGGQGSAQAEAEISVLSFAGQAAWSTLAVPGPTPLPRSESSAVLDAAGDRLLLYGGMTPCTDAGCPHGDLWALDLSGTPTWSLLLAGTASGPAARRNAAIAYEPATRRLILHGGNDVIDVFADTWVAEMEGRSFWRALATAPRERAGATVVHDPARSRALVFGGDASFCTFTCSQWGFNDVHAHGGGSWSPVPVAAPVPAGRTRHAAIFDVRHDRMIVFGGWGFSRSLNDTWELAFAGVPTWREIVAPHGAPPPRHDHSAIHDAGRDLMVVFGGRGAAVELADVWMLSLAGEPRWVEVIPDGPAPRARQAHAAIHDPARGRMVIFGGQGGGAALSDVWVLEWTPDARWRQLQPMGTPPTIGSPRSIYDPLRDRMIVMAPESRQLYALEFSPALRWRSLTPVGIGPAGRGQLAVAYDSGRHRMLTFGGGGAFGEFYNDLWALQLDVPAFGRVEVAMDPPPGTRPGVRPAPGAMSLGFELDHPSPAVVTVHGVDGRRVRTLGNGLFVAGPQVVRWDGRDDHGRPTSRGIYWIHARANGRRYSQMVVHLH